MLYQWIHYNYGACHIKVPLYKTNSCFKTRKSYHTCKIQCFISGSNIISALAPSMESDLDCRRCNSSKIVAQICQAWIFQLWAITKIPVTCYVMKILGWMNLNFQVHHSYMESLIIHAASSFRFWEILIDIQCCNNLVGG